MSEPKPFSDEDLKRFKEYISHEPMFLGRHNLNALLARLDAPELCMMLKKLIYFLETSSYHNAPIIPQAKKIFSTIKQ